MNPYERAARQRKAAALVAHAVRAWATLPADTRAGGTLSEALADFDDIEWSRLADAAGQHRPSLRTRALVVALTAVLDKPADLAALDAWVEEGGSDAGAE